MTKSQKQNLNLKNGCQSFLAFLVMSKHIVKVAVLLLPLSVLLFGCSTAEKQEPTWNDMYEVRSYQVETITNEIITTVFICRQTETNKVISVAKEAEDFGGYEFQPIGEAEEPVVKQNLTTPEFQCVDGSCEVKEK